jgi:hypothetical protein
MPMFTTASLDIFYALYHNILTCKAFRSFRRFFVSLLFYLTTSGLPYFEDPVTRLRDPVFSEFERRTYFLGREKLKSFTTRKTRKSGYEVEEEGKEKRT